MLKVSCSGGCQLPGRLPGIPGEALVDPVGPERGGAILGLDSRRAQKLSRSHLEISGQDLVHRLDSSFKGKTNKQTKVRHRMPK